MKMTLLAFLLAMTAVAQAADSSPYFICNNINAASKAPSDVLVAAQPEGMIGLYNGGSLTPPRAAFGASPVSVSNPREFTYGAVAYQSAHEGFPDFTSATVDFDAHSAIIKASFVTATGTITYANCKMDSDNQ